MWVVRLVIWVLSVIACLMWISGFFFLIDSTSLSLEDRYLTLGLVSAAGIPFGGITVVPILAEWLALKRLHFPRPEASFQSVLIANIFSTVILIAFLPFVLLGGVGSNYLLSLLYIPSYILEMTQENLVILAEGPGIFWVVVPLIIATVFMSGVNTFLEAPFLLRHLSRRSLHLLYYIFMANLGSSLLSLILFIVVSTVVPLPLR